MDDVLPDASATLLSDIKDECPVAPMNGGALRDSLTEEVWIGGESARVEVRSDKFYAPYVIYGTDPHPIDPVNASCLHWIDGSGVGVFAKHVEHPGTAPNDFPRRAWDNGAGQSFMDAVRAAVRRNLTVEG